MVCERIFSTNLTNLKFMFLMFLQSTVQIF
jgi:hypothetical protein